MHSEAPRFSGLRAAGKGQGKGGRGPPAAAQNSWRERRQALQKLKELRSFSQEVDAPTTKLNLELQGVFIAENADVVAKFLAVTADANAAWNASQPEFMANMIAVDAGMSVEDAKSSMSTFVFPDTAAQLSQAWLGGNAQTFMKGVADVFVNAGSIDSSKDSYADNVNVGPLTAAKDM